MNTPPRSSESGEHEPQQKSFGGFSAPATFYTNSETDVNSPAAGDGSVTSSASRMTHDTTEEHLRYLTAEFTRALQAKDFGKGWIWSHFDPNFKSNTHYNEKEYVTGLDKYFEEPAQALRTFPEIEVDTLGPFEADVDERAGKATIYVTFVVTGAPPGVTRQNLAIVDFRLGKDKWMVVKMTTIRGFGDIGLP